MIIKPLSLQKLKQLWLELFLNKTNKVSDISNNSTLSAVAYGCSKVAQKALKDIAIVESQLMPDSASGEYLDTAGSLFSAISRNSSSVSSTSVTLVATSGTVYDKTQVTFATYDGIVFVPEEDITIGDNGFGYLKVRSQSVGSNSNVAPNSIIIVNNAPVGHIAVTNEFMAQGGADSESDELFRQRIKKHTNIVAKYTETYYSQIFRLFNENILRVIFQGINDDGEKVISIVTENGITLTESELDELLENVTPYFSIRDLNKFGDTIGILLKNVDWYYVGDPVGDGSGTGIDFRVQLWNGYDADVVRKNIQIQMSRYLDFRFWTKGKKVEWDDLLSIVKNTEGVRYVADTYFKPSVDEPVPISRLPRIRKFIMRDLNGNIISGNNNIISPIFYPSEE